MTEEQFEKTRQVEIARKALNDFIVEAMQAGVLVHLEMTEQTIDATYQYRDLPIKAKPFE